MTTTAPPRRHLTHPTRPDLDLMKQVNRQFVTGVTVVTAMDDDTPRGLAVNAFSSISLDPPTVMVCVQRTSSTHDCLFRATHLAINILSTDQLDVVNAFAAQGRRQVRRARLGAGPVRQPADRAQQRPDGGRDPRTAAGQHPHALHLPRRRTPTVTDRHPMVYSAGQFFDGGALTPLG